MHRIDTQGNRNNRFWFPPPGTIPGDAVSTQISADWLNAIQEELAAVIEGSGMRLDKASMGQLQAAIRKEISVATKELREITDKQINELKTQLTVNANHCDHAIQDCLELADEINTSAYKNDDKLHDEFKNEIARVDAKFQELRSLLAPLFKDYNSREWVGGDGHYYNILDVFARFSPKSFGNLETSGFASSLDVKIIHDRLNEIEKRMQSHSDY